MSNPGHEPSMEEILASIRKIIAEDHAEIAPASAQEDDVLELTQEVDGPVPPTSGADHFSIFSDDTRRTIEDAFAAIPSAPEPARLRTDPPPMPPVAGQSVESVFERAVRDSFEPVLRRYLDDNSAAVIERMTPLIREWMDINFPDLLEGVLRAEIDRVARSRIKR